MGSRKGAVIAEKLSTDKEFDAFLSKSGLIVIDTYQAWCGPCKPVQVVFKKLKTDIGPAKIHFGLADVDKIEKLEDYRGVNGGGCEPLFLFFAGGNLVDELKGCNAPKLEEMCVANVELSEQCSVMSKLMKKNGGKINGKMKRKESSDLKTGTPAEQASAEEEVPLEPKLSDHSINKCITVAVLNPDIAAQLDMVPQITSDIEASGIEIIKKEVRQLTDEEIGKLSFAASESGPSLVILCTKGETGESAIKSLQNIIDVLEGENHCSKSVLEAEKDLLILYPDFNIPRVSMSAQLREPTQSDHKEQTLTIIMPKAAAQFSQDIIQEIEKLEFTIAKKVEYEFSEESAKKYFESQNEADESLVQNVCGGMCLILVLEKEDAISDWKKALGPQDKPKETPDSLRATFAVDDVNMILASSNASQVQQEMNFFFPSA